MALFVGVQPVFAGCTIIFRFSPLISFFGLRHWRKSDEIMRVKGHDVNVIT